MSNQQVKSKAISLGLLFKADVANPNAGWTEGIVTVLKKVERPDGKAHPYISGQALRRYLRDTLSELPEVKKEELSPPVIAQEPKAPVITEGIPKDYIDDDLFGFMRAIRGATRRRESPLRVAPAYGLFPYTGDRDLGTRSALEAISELVEDKDKLETLAKLLKVDLEGADIEEVKKEIVDKGVRGSMFETEITHNVFRTTLLLEIDRVGRWENYETTSGSKGNLEDPERKRRVILLLKAIKYLWGGGRKTRLLLDLTPQVIIYARLTKKIPLFLSSLKVSFNNGEYEVNTPHLKETLDDYKGDLQKVILGVREAFIPQANKTQLQGLLNQGEEIFSIGNAIDEMVKDIESAEF